MRADKLNILVVAENTAVHSGFKKVFRGSTLTLQGSTFATALKKTGNAKSKPDAILVALPGNSARSRRFFSGVMDHAGNIPVIVILCAGTTTDVLHFIRTGAQECLIMKTPEAELLHRTVLSCIERERKLSRLQSIGEKYKDLFENNPVPMYYCDENAQQIIMANRSARNLYGYSKEEFSNLRLSDIRPSKDIRGFFVMKETSDPKDTFYTGQWIHRKKDGSLFDVEVNTRLFEEGKDRLQLVAIEDITEKKRMLERLLESEFRFRYVAENFPNGIVAFLDKHFRIVNISGSDLGSLGIDAASMSGKLFTDGLDAASAAQVRKTLLKAFSGVKVSFEMNLYGNSFLVNAISAYNGKKTEGFLLVVMNNISRLKKTSERIHLQSSIIENVSDSVIVTDMNNKIVFWNKSSTEMFGYGQMEMLGKNFDSLFVEHNDGTDFSNLTTRLNAHGSVYDVVRRRTKDNRMIWTELKVTYNYNVEHKLTGLIYVSKDITDQRAEEHLLKLFQSVILNANDGVAICDETSDPDQRFVVFVNSAFSRITGYQPREMMGKTLAILAGPETNPDVRNNVRAAMHKQESFVEEFLLYRKDGSTFWVNLAVMPVSDQSGANSHWVFLMRDITEKKQSEELLKKQNEELTKTNQELDRFVYSASHDLRAPLTSVLGLAGLMRREKYGNEAGVYIDKIEESVKRLDKLIQNIIHYSRNSRLAVEREPIDFREMFEAAVGLHKFAASSSAIRFETEIDFSGEYLSDRGRWQIILNNLVSNSIKFANPAAASYVRLVVKEADGELQVIIEDNGIGIAPEHIDSIFKMFYRATEVSDGSGLGLYIVKQTVQLIGGEITVESEQGQFTRFIVKTPLYI